MKKEVKQFLQEEMEKEKERLLAEVKQDETLQDIEVPDEIEERLFAQIHAYEEEQRKSGKEECGAERASEASEMSAEDAELIRLGRMYRRRRRLGKYIVLAAVLVMVLAIGMTSLGGPEKVIRMITEAVNGGGSRVKMNTDDGSVHSVAIADEREAYQMIKDKWNLDVVELSYLPQGVAFKKAEIDELFQVAYFLYQKEGEIKIHYQITVGHMPGSYVSEEEDEEEYCATKMVQGVPVTITKQAGEDGKSERWTIRFEWQNAQYTIFVFDEKLEEVNKIVENLIFL